MSGRIEEIIYAEDGPDEYSCPQDYAADIATRAISEFVADLERETVGRNGKDKGYVSVGSLDEVKRKWGLT